MEHHVHFVQQRQIVTSVQQQPINVQSVNTVSTQKEQNVFHVNKKDVKKTFVVLNSEHVQNVWKDIISLVNHVFPVQLLISVWHAQDQPHVQNVRQVITQAEINV